MTVDDLKTGLLKRGLRPNAVSFQNGALTAAEQYCIDFDNNVWEVYYFERGNKNDLKQFNDEQAACAYLLKILEADKTVWIPNT